ncbi:MAG: S41 family peptidase [Treponema sp.]|nr:S41 family peptidase [Treponema sp.]
MNGLARNNKENKTKGRNRIKIDGMNRFVRVFLGMLCGVFLGIFCNSCTGKAEIKKDCEYLRVILTQGYAGYESAVEMGFDVDKAIKHIKRAYGKKFLGKWVHREVTKGDLDVRAFQECILEVLRDELKIEDMHFSVASDYFYDFLSKPYRVLYSELYFELLGEDFVVFADYRDENEVKKNPVVRGQKYLGDEALLFPVFIECEEEGGLGVKKVFRFGSFNNGYVDGACFEKLVLDGDSFDVLVRADLPIGGKDGWIGYIETKDSIYVSLSDLILGVENPVKYEKCMAQLEECRRRLRKAKNKKNVILDLRSNYGGQTRFVQNLLAPIFYGDDWKGADGFAQCIKQASSGSASYETPVTVASRLRYFLSKPGFSKEMIDRQIEISKDMQENPRIYWSVLEDDTAQLDRLKVKLSESLYEKVHQIAEDLESREEEEIFGAKKIVELPQAGNTEFKGKLIILMNNKTASSAENGIEYAFLADKDLVVLIGENTAGCVDFGETYQYELPDSKIKVTMGTVDYRKQPGLAFNSKWHGDARGFFPDYWCDGPTLLSTLVGVTEDGDLREALQGIENEAL